MMGNIVAWGCASSGRLRRTSNCSVVIDMIDMIDISANDVHVGDIRIARRPAVQVNIAGHEGARSTTGARMLWQAVIEESWLSI